MCIRDDSVSSFGSWIFLGAVNYSDSFFFFSAIIFFFIVESLVFSEGTNFYILLKLMAC